MAGRPCGCMHTVASEACDRRRGFPVRSVMGDYRLMIIACQAVNPAVFVFAGEDLFVRPFSLG